MAKYDFTVYYKDTNMVLYPDQSVGRKLNLIVSNPEVKSLKIALQVCITKAFEKKFDSEIIVGIWLNKVYESEEG